MAGRIREDPLSFKDDPGVRQWLQSLGGTVQRFADVLEKELAAALESAGRPPENPA